jgi:hypothetical protein
MGKLINGIKYMCIHDVDEYKKKSLNDQFYFTLRDIFWNTDSFDVMMIINNFNHMLTDGISFDSRTNTFQYTNILYQKTELKKILRFLNRIKQTGWFEFIESKDKDEYEDKEESIDEEYILFDDWWKQFEELRNLLKEQYEKINV